MRVHVESSDMYMYVHVLSVHPQLSRLDVQTRDTHRGYGAPVYEVVFVWSVSSQRSVKSHTSHSTGGRGAVVMGRTQLIVQLECDGRCDGEGVIRWGGGVVRVLLGVVVRVLLGVTVRVY